uniref:30S ribosomal protein S1, chloroplastic n=1 Tax=Anthurium amnicola TaxID=1678845 RepID=A0A1D1XFV2_9ARAE
MDKKNSSDRTAILPVFASMLVGIQHATWSFERPPPTPTATATVLSSPASILREKVGNFSIASPFESTSSGAPGRSSCISTTLELHRPLGCVCVCVGKSAMLATLGSMNGFYMSSQPFGVEGASRPSMPTAAMYPSSGCFSFRRRRASCSPFRTTSCAVLVSSSSGVEEEEAVRQDSKAIDDTRQGRKSADWKAARAYKESSVIYDGRIEGFNNGGLLVRFYSLLGFLPYPLLSPSHSCKEPQRAIQDIAKGLVGSYISVKVIQASEEERKLIFSEKDAVWSKYSNQVKIGDIFEARVGSVEDYGAFIHLRFPEGYYHLTGLVHVSEVSWDLVQDVRDVLNEGDDIKVKVTQIDREKSRITLSIKQLEDDPLLETLDKVIPQGGQLNVDTVTMSNSANIEPLPGLESICKELLQEDGISDIRIGRQGLEKRVVSQDLQLWLSNVPAKDNQFTLLARAGRQVQEVHLTTTLDQEGIKQAVQRVLGRVE